MLISGDALADLLTMEKPEDVEVYCRRLIDEMRDGCGFMLTMGCECLVNVKLTNTLSWKAMATDFTG